MIIAAKSRKERMKKRIILLEGHRLISDAILSGAEARCIYFSQIDSLKRLPVHETNAVLYKVQYQHMKIWSDLETPPGIMGRKIITPAKFVYYCVTICCSLFRKKKGKK